MQETSARDRAPTAPRGIFALLGDLGGAGLDLAHNTVKLAACESRVVLRLLAVRAGVFIGAVVFAALGLILILGAGALLLEQAGVPMWVALALVGLVALAGGVVTAMRMLRRLGDRDLAFPATLAEFQTDVETLRRRARAAGSPDEDA